ncbi:hypothetical protein [Haladaptatus sp. CMAA 1911]|uniref:hypothetical protein n=1 Tax=unclassified Haladaptatus TaxID=2622732 RepID=UPI0037548FF1
MTARLQRSAYTGENRCIPCTVVNLLIAAAMAVGFAFVTTSLAVGLIVFAAFVIVIYLRGYLVPGTPKLTKRYFPSRLLAMFGKEVVSSDFEGRTTDTDTENESLLTANGVTGDDGVTLTDEFRESWTEQMRDVADGGIQPTDVAALFDATSVSQHGDQSFVVDERKSVRWGSNAALVADLAADTVLRERTHRWTSIDTERRESVRMGLRLCLKRCPTCGGPLGVEETRIDPCCQRPHLSAQSVCEECGAVLADTAVVDDGETVGVRSELLQV